MKYKIGNYVILKRIFSKELDPAHGNYDYSHGDLIVKITGAQKHSMGYCYSLFHPTVDLGGVNYWEEELHRIDHDPEEEYWKMWGDQ
jgi:hypothetical protein